MKEKGLFHTILSRDPDGARQMAERLLAEKERRQEHHCEVILRPYFGSLDQIRTLRHAGRLLVKCIEEICAAALSNDPLLERLGLTIEERKLARIDHGNSGFSVFPQIETSLTRHGLHIVDIIADGLPDIANAFEMARLRSSNPTSREFTRHYQMKVPPFYELIHELFLSRYARWGGRSQTPTIALILDMSAGISIEASMIHGHLNSAGLTTLVCDPRDLLFHDSRLMAHGSAVDIAYRLAPLTESNMGEAARPY